MKRCDKPGAVPRGPMWAQAVQGKPTANTTQVCHWVHGMSAGWRATQDRVTPLKGALLDNNNIIVI